MSNKRGRDRSFSLCNFPKKNRRGSHIDVILSFVIFIGFIVFFYAIIQPSISAKQSKAALLDHLGTKIIENLTGGDLIGISTGIDYDGSPQNCLELEDFLINNELGSANIIVKNLDGDTFPSSYSGNNLYIDTISDPQLEYVFKIYYSSSFTLIPLSAPSPCQNLKINPPNPAPDVYSMGQTENYSLYNFIWEGNLNQLIESYNNAYSAVRTLVGLSAANNFRFDFTYENQTIIGTEDNIPSNVNVYSRIFPVVYVSQGGNLEAGNLIVKIW